MARVVLIRHGETAANDPDNEIVRSWSPVPLTPEGHAAVRLVAGEVKQFAPTRLFTSDVVRAIQTAEVLAPALGLRPEPTMDLRDWNVGAYIGQPVKEVKDDLTEYALHAPYATPPGGEPYATFLARFLPYLDRLLQAPETVAAVTHARCVVAAAAWVKRGAWSIVTDPATLAKPSPVQPGGLYVLTPTPHGITADVLGARPA